MRLRLALALLLLAGPIATPANAQPRDFSCVGVEDLESDTASLRFARNADRLPAGAAEALAPLAEAAREDHQRNICVLGYAAGDEGGAQTAGRLAARRARAVAEELSRMGVERDRIRAEARTRGFTRGQGDRQAGVRVIVLPSLDRPARPGMPAPGISINFLR
ncbi:MAG TPA: OmpA family protein [Roseococcus sp.]|jgi:hypothetical protein|nr:OmpA family protein [Roseococcus sp.]